MNIKRDVFLRLRGAGQVVADLDMEIQETLYDLSSRGDFLTASTTITTEDGTAAYSEPSDLKGIDELHISGGNYLERGSYQEYLDSIEDQDSPSTGEPEKYCRQNGYIYLFDPVPGDVYTVTFDYWKFHPDIITTGKIVESSIAFDERFAEAIRLGTLYRVWSGQLSAHPKADEQANRNKLLYEEQVNLLRASKPVTWNQTTKYWDA